MTIIEARHALPSLHTINHNTTAAPVLSSATEKEALIGSVNRDCTIDQVKFGTQAVSTGCTVRIRIEGVDASGAPDGVLVHANATGTVVIANTDDNVLKDVNLGGNVTLSAGQKIAVVWQVESGTPAVCRIDGQNNAGALIGTYPYRNKYDGATWTISTTPPRCIFRCVDGSHSWIQGIAPGHLTSTQTFNTGTTPDELGNLIESMPYSCYCDGIIARLQNTAQPMDVVLYDSLNTPLGSFSLPTIRGSASGFQYCPFDPVLLQKGQLYRYVYKATSATNNAITVESTVSDYLKPVVRQTQRTDADVWSEPAAGGWGYPRVDIALNIKSIVLPDPSFVY